MKWACMCGRQYDTLTMMRRCEEWSHNMTMNLHENDVARAMLAGEMAVLGIDPGQSCGWALMLPDGGVQSGVWDLKPKGFEGGGMMVVKLGYCLSQVGMVYGRTELAVFFEEVAAHEGTQAGHTYGAIVHTVMAWCEDREYPYLGVPVGTIKKHATGRGNANKNAMVSAAKEKWGKAISDDNEADALWVADYGNAIVRGASTKGA